jgi:hypothetical protein
MAADLPVSPVSSPVRGGAPAAAKISPEAREDYICAICQDILVEPVRAPGCSTAGWGTERSPFGPPAAPFAVRSAWMSPSHFPSQTGGRTSEGSGDSLFYSTPRAHIEHATRLPTLMKAHGCGDPILPGQRPLRPPLRPALPAALVPGLRRAAPAGGRLGGAGTALPALQGRDRGGRPRARPRAAGRDIRGIAWARGRLCHSGSRRCHCASPRAATTFETGWGASAVPPMSGPPAECYTGNPSARQPTPAERERAPRPAQAFPEARARARPAYQPAVALRGHTGRVRCLLLRRLPAREVPGRAGSAPVVPPGENAARGCRGARGGGEDPNPRGLVLTAY